MSILDFLITLIFLGIEALGITYTLSILIPFLDKKNKPSDEYSFIELFIAIFITLVLNKIIINNLFNHHRLLNICIFIICYKIY